MTGDREYLGAVDVGGTKVAALVASIDGEILAREEEALCTEKGDFLLQQDEGNERSVAWYGPASQIERMIHRMMEEEGIDALSGIGIGSAGPLKSGAIRNPPNFAVSIPAGMPASPLYVPLVEPLESAFRAPVTLENDCNTAVLGEAYFGVGRDVSDKGSLHLVYVTMSTGLGGGVWSGGHLLLGKEGNAAEIGHILVKENGLRCGCGNDGCAEAYCSGRGIMQNARLHLVNSGMRAQSLLLNLLEEEAGKKSHPEQRSRWDLLEFITPQIVFQAAGQGDEIAASVIDDFIHYGGIVLAAIANAYDPTVITLGGSIAVNHPEIVAPMHSEMCKHLNVSAPDLLITPLGKRAVEYGAIVLAQRARG